MAIKIEIVTTNAYYNHDSTRETLVIDSIEPNTTDGSGTFTVKLKEGYIYNGASGITFSSTSDRISTSNIGVNKSLLTDYINKSYMTFDVDLSSLNVDTVYLWSNSRSYSKATYYDFTNRFTNATVTGTANVVVGSTLNITLTPDEGYEFDGTPYLQNSVGNYNFTVNEDGTATYKGTITDDDYNIVNIYATLKEKTTTPTYLTVTNNLKNATVSTDLTQLVAGTETTILVNSNSGYYFDVAPTITDNGTTYTFTVSEDKSSATVTFTPSGNFSIDGSAVETVSYVAFTVRSPGTDEYNATVTGITNVPVGNDNLNIVITPSDGYELDGTPYMVSSDVVTYDFTLKTDGTATFTGSLAGATSATIYIKTKVATTPTPTTTTGFIRIYTPTESVLDDFSNYNLVNPTDGSSIDLTKYIYGLYHVWAPVTNNGTAKIYLSRNDTNIESTYTDTPIVSVESDEIELSHKYGNIYDYSPFTDSKIYLPFIGYIDTDTNVLYAGKIKIKYDINLLNMDTLATVLVDGVEMYKGEGKCGFNIPFNLGQYSYNTGEFDLNAYVLDRTPKIILTHSTPYENGTDKAGKQISSYVDNLSSLSGYNVVTDVKLATNNQLTNTEKEEIISILATGAYF